MVVYRWRKPDVFYLFLNNLLIKLKLRTLFTVINCILPRIL